MQRPMTPETQSLRDRLLAKVEDYNSRSFPLLTVADLDAIIASASAPDARLVEALEWIADPLRDVGVHAGGCRCSVHTARAALAQQEATR